MRSALTFDHWKLYAQADLLLDVSFGRPPGVPGGTSGQGGVVYAEKIGDHEYPTDRAYITGRDRKRGGFWFTSTSRCRGPSSPIRLGVRGQFAEPS